MVKKVVTSVGGTLEGYLDEIGEGEEVYGAAVKRVLSLQLEAARKELAISKSEMATKLHTSRTQINRVLDPRHVSVSLDTLDKVARSLGKRLRVELIDP
jgi:antitoxin HicB